MLFVFDANEIRDQIAHAQSAVAHREPSAMAPSLHLVKTGDAIHLVSDGLPVTGKVANGVELEVQSQPGDNDRASSGVGDFIEPIAVDAFTRSLARNQPRLEVVVTRTYINVLGGQPDRRPVPSQLGSWAHSPRRQPAARPVTPSRGAGPKR